MPGIVIYGGELGGVAAALSAARRSPAGTEVSLVFPEGAPGGIATVGGHCAWERRPWTHGNRRADPQGGNFAVWLQELGPVYRPGSLAAALGEDLAAAGVHVYPRHEIEAVLPVAVGARPAGRTRSRKPRSVPLGAIGALRLRPLEQGDQGPVLSPSADAVELAGSVFVDASATGRLARLSGLPTSVGRSDWNADGRQMAASLLLAIEGLDWEALLAARDPADKAIWGTTTETSPDGLHRTFWGGAHVVTQDAVLASFTEAHPGFRLGAPRAWEEERGVFWLSALHAYNVDGRRRAYDAGTERDCEPVTMMSRDVDTVWEEARRLAGSGDLLGALRRFPGLEGVRVVEVGGGPRTGEVLLLRETLHALGPKPDRFALTVEDLTGAGVGAQDGLDQRHRARRIGLGFSWLESAGYTEGEVLRTTAAATNPAYLPLDAILCPPVTNLLIPGYAARIESRAWWAMRTAPNQCVLGDAAGVAAAFSAREGIPVVRFGNAEVAAIQNWLVGEGAVLDKW